jgi:CO dehydrogenase maturation factor
MPYTIAITGKGGVGKTTVAATLIARLTAHGLGPVLAVDADPNTGLDAALGVHAASTIGRIREETRELAGKGMTTGIAKQQMLEMKIAECLVESDNFDLIAMGRPEGPGCYCYANNVLRQAIASIAENYPYIVIDNEAGLENLSRRIVQQVDLMIMVADPSRQGLATLKRLHELAVEMEIRYGRLAMVINRCRRAAAPPEAVEVAESAGADHLVALPDDTEVADTNENGRPLATLRAEGAFVGRIDRLLKDAGVIGGRLPAASCSGA